MAAPDDPRRYALLLDLAGRDVLVVGGGPVAARRVAGLLASGARVSVVAPMLCADLTERVAAGEIRWAPREAGPADVVGGPASLLAGTGADPAGGPGVPAHHGVGPVARPDEPAVPNGVDPASPGARPDPGAPPRWWLIHTATGAPRVDEAVAAAAEGLGIWCARADRAEVSSAHVPAVAVGPGGVQVAVSGGGDPGLARAVRDAVSELLAVGGLPLRRTRGAGPGRAPVPDADPAAAGIGRVVLVGGGPGDPGLLTVAGRQWLARADVVVTDRLAPTAVLDELDPAVEVVDVGKTAGNHPIPQHEINRLLVDRARGGATVVRLKGGDPFVLGRGGEEALHCVAHGVPVEVVPGVTSAISVPAAAGIPVTHRGVTTSLVVASAHAGAGSAAQAARTAPDDATLVLLMGLSALAGTAAELLAAGRPGDTPAAVVSRGWSPDQRTVVGTLATIAGLAAEAGLPGPAVVVVGQVVALRDQLVALDRRAEA